MKMPAIFVVLIVLEFFLARDIAADRSWLVSQPIS
jgi:hypothetical protein